MKEDILSSKLKHCKRGQSNMMWKKEVSAIQIFYNKQKQILN